jgi:hypothetical protein
MLLWRAMVMIVFAVPLASVATAQSVAEGGATVHARLRGLSSAEAEVLIAKLRELQSRLRGGEAVFFQLLSGAPASYPMTTVSPRDAFLGLTFDDIESIERMQTGNRLWQPFKLVLTPNGPGRLFWDVEVVLGFYGQVERVEMMYRPPAPP